MAACLANRWYGEGMVGCLTRFEHNPAYRFNGARKLSTKVLVSIRAGQPAFRTLKTGGLDSPVLFLSGGIDTVRRSCLYSVYSLFYNWSVE